MADITQQLAQGIDITTPLLQGLALKRQGQQDLLAQQQQQFVNEQAKAQALQKQKEATLKGLSEQQKVLLEIGDVDSAIDLMSEVFKVGNMGEIDVNKLKEAQKAGEIDFNKLTSSLSKITKDKNIPQTQKEFGIKTILGRIKEAGSPDAPLQDTTQVGTGILQQPIETARQELDQLLRLKQQNQSRFTTNPRLKAKMDAFDNRIDAEIKKRQDVIPKAGSERGVFAKINPKDFTSDSIAKFQSGGSTDFSMLVPTADSLDKKISGLDKFKAEDVLRKEFLNQSKDFSKVRDSFQRVVASSEEPSAAGDLSLIFNFMKILDPGSVVRESEFANAATAQEFMERKGFSFEAVARVWAGERLSEAAREDFVGRARKLNEKQEGQHKKRESEFKRIAVRRRLDSQNVIVDLGSFQADVAPKFKEGQTATDANGNKVIFRGGTWQPL